MSIIKYIFLSALSIMLLTATVACGSNVDKGEDNMKKQNSFKYAGSHYVISETEVQASAVAGDVSEDIYGGAFMEDPLLESDFSAEVTVRPKSKVSDVGILFGAKEVNETKGFEGYAFTVGDNRVHLYQIQSLAPEMTVTELGSRKVEPFARGADVKLRIEMIDNVVRCYFCDDLDGVEPWPEFEFALTMCGIGIGYFDNGQGAAFEELTVEPLVNKDQPTATYQNPVFGSLSGADPYILYHDGLYYLYCSGYAPYNDGYWYYTSSDLVNWTRGERCAGFMNDVGAGKYWAPEVYEINGKFYLIATVDLHIAVAVADSPKGPFVYQKDYLVDKGIDGHIFIDDDRRMYLFYTISTRVWGCELKMNGDSMSVKQETVRTVFGPGTSGEEAPFLLKHNGLYYLTTSTNSYTSPDYSVNLSISKTPLGDYKKYEGSPILCKTAQVHGTGHHSFVMSPDGSEMFIVYHKHASPGVVAPRTICIDRARFAPTESGVDRIEVYGPTYTPQPIPR